MGKILQGIKRCCLIFLLGLIFWVSPQVYAGMCPCDFSVEDIDFTRLCSVRVELKRNSQRCLPPPSMFLQWVSLRVTAVDEQGQRHSWSLPLDKVVQCLYNANPSRKCWIPDLRVPPARHSHFLLPGRYEITASLLYRPRRYLRYRNLKIYDSNRQNDYLTKSFTCNRPLPDLTIKRIWSESKRGGRCVIKMKLENQGGLILESPFWDRISLNVKKGSQSTTFRIGSCSGYSILEKGGEVICEVPAPVGEMGRTERSRVTATIERSEDLLKEGNYNNNRATAELWCLPVTKIKKKFMKPSEMLHTPPLEQHKQPPRIKWPKK